MNSEFTVFPAIDLRRGQVVRLQQGDPARQKIYDSDPASTARRWLQMGASWLHVVNLDGAFGEKDKANRLALERILSTAWQYGAQVQFGGGLRTLSDLETILEMGVARVVIGTVAIESPEIMNAALQRFGADRVAAGIDAREGRVRVRGWISETGVIALDLAARLRKDGLSWLVFTDIARDGVGSGVNLTATLGIAGVSGLHVIASGGVNGIDDIRRCREAGLAGVIIGRALYEGKIDLKTALNVNDPAKEA